MSGTACISRLARQRLAEGRPTGRCDEATARRLWWAALETLQQDLLIPLDVQSRWWLAAPLPALYDPTCWLDSQGWVWAPEELGQLNSLVPALSCRRFCGAPSLSRKLSDACPLHPDDCLDPLLIVITPSARWHWHCMDWKQPAPAADALRSHHPGTSWHADRAQLQEQDPAMATARTT